MRTIAKLHLNRDHPRSRGVYAAALPDKWIDGGSSPLARGLHSCHYHRHRRRGIIPARAGFTHDAPVIVHSCRDHPRSRGVYPRSSRRGISIRGSSPLARGLLREYRLGLPARRIIPARAGFTPWRGPVPGPAWDHPRSRGVYPISTRPRGRWTGSSPLARGLLDEIGVRNGNGGIIPARAGFTTPFTFRDGAT